MKRWKWIIIVVVVVFLCAVATGAFFLHGKSFSIGRCVIADNGACLLICENTPIVLSDQSLSTDPFADLQTGDKILVLHDGIRESYPAQTGAYLCMRLSGGSVEDVPQSVLNALAELGWISFVNVPTDPEPTPDPESYTFTAQYIRTNGYHENAAYPAVIMIRSRAELEQYYNENKDRYDLERKEQVYADTTIGFLDACDKYDEDYFAEQDLILILLEEGSGSIRHEVTDVQYDFEQGEWQIAVKRLVPEEGTCDMAEWHIMVEIQTGKVVEENAPIRVILE